MSLIASEVLSHRDISELTHFGEHEEKYYQSSSPATNKALGIASIDSMSDEKIFETEKEMNCLDILAGVVSRCSSSEVEQKPLLCSIATSRTEQFCRPTSERNDSVNTQEHRVSCHRCGNIRKRKIVCERPQCPHIFCGRCADKMKIEHGADVFVDGCPVCHELCCCVNKTVYCNRKNHCYRKCPASKSVDSIAKANTPLWDYRSDAYTGRTHYSNNNSNETSCNNENLFSLGSFAKSCSSDRSNTNNDMVTSDNIIYSDGLGQSYPLPSPNFHQIQTHSISVSKHGSLDFLAAAVSIIDNKDHVNDNIEINYGDTTKICNNANQYYIRDSEEEMKENSRNFSRNHIQTDMVRKRTRESGNVRSSSISVTREDDGDNSDGRIYSSSTTNQSMGPLSFRNEGSRNYKELNKINNYDKYSNNDSESNNENDSKAIRKVSDQFEFSARLPTPPPLYFLASNLLPSKNFNLRSIRDVTCPSDEFSERREMTWNGSTAQISDSSLRQQDLCSLSKLQYDRIGREVADIGIVEGRDGEVEIEVANNLPCQGFDHTHGNSVPFRTVSNSYRSSMINAAYSNIKQDGDNQEISFEIDKNPVRSTDSSSSLSSSQTCLPINQLVRNVSNEKYISRNLISGPNYGNHNDNNDNYYYYQQIKETVPRNGAYEINKSNSNISPYQQSSRFYHSIVPLSSQLHPPPL